jgi:hypothetical protein
MDSKGGKEEGSQLEMRERVSAEDSQTNTGIELENKLATKTTKRTCDRIRRRGEKRACEEKNLNLSMETKFESLVHTGREGGETQGEFDTHIERNASPY